MEEHHIPGVTCRVQSRQKRSNDIELIIFDRPKYHISFRHHRKVSRLHHFCSTYLKLIIEPPTPAKSELINSDRIGATAILRPGSQNLPETIRKTPGPSS